MLTRNVSEGVAAAGRRLFKTDTAVAREALRLVGDSASFSGKLDSEVGKLVSDAQNLFARRRFDESIASYRAAIGSVETPTDSQHILRTLVSDLDHYGRESHLPWNSPTKVAKKFETVVDDAQKMVAYGDINAVVAKLEKAFTSRLPGRTAPTFAEMSGAKATEAEESLYAYAKDLVERIWFPFHINGLSSAKRSSLTAKVEAGSWKLADHFVAIGELGKARTFVKSATAPTISRPSFDRALKEVDMFFKYGKAKDFTGRQASDLALEARNMYRFSGKPIEKTQEAVLDILARSVAFESRTMPAPTVFTWLLAHARSVDEVGALIDKAAKVGYKADIKRDVLASISAKPLGGVTLDGTTASVAAVNPIALVAYAEKHGFGAEASATLQVAYNAQGRGYRIPDSRHVSLGGLVAESLGLGH
jgi:hypothetical protein